jgi:hypothetical protein
VQIFVVSLAALGKCCRAQGMSENMQGGRRGQNAVCVAREDADGSKMTSRANRPQLKSPRDA